jgi:hypothetical protein
MPTPEDLLEKISKLVADNSRTCERLDRAVEDIRTLYGKLDSDYMTTKLCAELHQANARAAAEAIETAKATALIAVNDAKAYTIASEKRLKISLFYLKIMVGSVGALIMTLLIILVEHINRT